MTERLSIALDATSGRAALAERIALTATEVSPTSAPVSHTIPPAVDAGQAYYWRHAWQLGEQESRAELKAGLGQTFATAEKAIRWLLSDHQ